MDVNDEVFNRPGQGLYAWVLRDVYLAMIAGYGDSKPKFGQYGTYAKNGSLPHDTIESYVGTTTDSIVILWAIRFTDEQIKNHTAYDVEQVVGKDMKRILFGKSTEVFEIDMETLQDKVYEVMHGFKDGNFFRERKLTYSPRLRQEECIAQWKTLVSKWRSMKNAPPLSFLLGAIMRFGKNFTFLEMSRYVVGENGNVLVLTGNPDVFKSLEDDITKHINYDGWIYDELKNNKYDWKPSDNNVNVLAVSTQLLLNLNHRGKLVEFLSQFKWTIQGIDEADNKILTELVQEDIIDKIPVEIGRVWITGTFWKLLATGWFNDENSFIYDYIQQQIDRRDGTDKRAIPLDFYRMEVLDTISKQAKWYTDDEGFTLTKLFSFNEDTNTFIHETDVRDFVKSVKGIIPKTKFSPYKIANLKHTLWVLPDSTKAVIRLGDIIEEVTNGKTKVFRATGNEVKDINVVKKYMTDYPDVPTDTLTITRFCRGTTVGEWDATLFMNDTDSIEYYFQACFRPTSPLEGKEKGYVFDFNPNRTVEMLMEYATHAAALRGQTNPNVILKEFLDCFNIFSCDGDVEFVKDDIEKFINIIRDSTYSANTLRRSGRDYINFDNIDDDLLVKLMSLSKEKIKSLKIKITNSSLINKGNNYTTEVNGQSTRKVDYEKKFENDIVAKISTMMSRLPIICELPGYDTVEEISDRLPNNLFYGATKADKEVLRLLMDKKVIDTFKVNLQLVNTK